MTEGNKDGKRILKTVTEKCSKSFFFLPLVIEKHDNVSPMMGKDQLICFADDLYKV